MIISIEELTAATCKYMAKYCFKYYVLETSNKK